MENRPDTLRVYDGAALIFRSSGKWLHPLFDLGDFLASDGRDPRRFALDDTIIGKAAALLIVRMGIRTVKAGILSRPGLAVLAAAGAAVTYDSLVERILCRTEEELAEVDDPDQAYRMLAVRARRRPDA